MASTSKSNKSWSFSPTDTISSAQVNTNFTELHDYINDSVPLIYTSPSSGLLNGRIVASVSSNNLTVAVKQLDGTTDPSTTTPVWVNIGGTVRAITSALSVTANAGTNWFNSGSSELATQAIDYFVYIGFNATDGITIGFSRIPYVNLYSQFNTTNTNERFCRISTITNATANDVYTVVDRFTGILSAGAGYTWSSIGNVYGRPILNTNVLSWAPTLTASGSMSFGSVVYNNCLYTIDGKYMKLVIAVEGTTSGTATPEIRASLPISMSANIINDKVAMACQVISAGTNISGQIRLGGITYLKFLRSDAANWGIGALTFIQYIGELEI